MNATPPSLDAHPLSPGARELLAALEGRNAALDILPISTDGGPVSDGLLVCRADSRRMRIWPYGRLWMIRPEIREGGHWCFLADAGLTTTDPRQGLRAACSGTGRTADLVVSWMGAPDPHFLNPRTFPPAEG